MSITLQQLIHDVAEASRDLVEATAEVNAGDNLTFTSSIDLLDEDGHYRGAEAYFPNGRNIGLTRRVYASDFETGTITFNKALNFPILAGEKVELYNIGSYGLQRKQYTNLINRAIRDAGSTAGNPVVVTVTASYGGSTEIPSLVGIDSVCKVQYYDTYTSTWHDIRKATAYGKRGWYPLPEINGISFSYDWSLALSGYAIRARGYLTPTTLTNDSDTTTIDPEWIIETVVGTAEMSNPDNYNNLGPGQYSRNRADQVRGKIGPVPMANCARIR